MVHFTNLLGLPHGRARVLLLGILLACSSCSGAGGGDATGATYSCSVSFEGAVQDCSLYENVSASQVSGLQTGCTASGVATFGTAACPTAGVTGCCTNTLAPTDFTEIECTYTAAGVAALQSQCSAEKGTWSEAM